MTHSELHTASSVIHNDTIIKRVGTTAFSQEAGGGSALASTEVERRQVNQAAFITDKRDRFRELLQRVTAPMRPPYDGLVSGSGISDLNRLYGFLTQNENFLWRPRTGHGSVNSIALFWPQRVFGDLFDAYQKDVSNRDGNAGPIPGKLTIGNPPGLKGHWRNYHYEHFVLCVLDKYVARDGATGLEAIQAFTHCDTQHAPWNCQCKHSPENLNRMLDARARVMQPASVGEDNPVEVEVVAQSLLKPDSCLFTALAPPLQSPCDFDEFDASAAGSTSTGVPLTTVKRRRSLTSQSASISSASALHSSAPASTMGGGAEFDASATEATSTGVPLTTVKRRRSLPSKSTSTSSLSALPSAASASTMSGGEVLARDERQRLLRDLCQKEKDARWYWGLFQHACDVKERSKEFCKFMTAIDGAISKARGLGAKTREAKWLELKEGAQKAKGDSPAAVLGFNIDVFPGDLTEQMLEHEEIN